MTGPSSGPDADPAASLPLRGRWQVGLRTLFLLVMVIAVWMAVVINSREVASLENRVEAMRPLARELMVDDPAKLAVVQLHDLWTDESRWDVYLPDGDHRLCLATRGIGPKELTTASRCSPLPAGRHRLSINATRQGEGWRIRVLSDGAELLAVEEPKSWGGSGYSSTGAQHWVSRQLPPDQPAILYRRRYEQLNGSGQSSLGDGPADGILLWIEPAATPGG